MAEKEIAVIEAETKESGGCCEPECGPTTCEPSVKVVEAKAVEEPAKASSGWRPSTCGGRESHGEEP